MAEKKKAAAKKAPAKPVKKDTKKAVKAAKPVAKAVKPTLKAAAKKAEKPAAMKKEAVVKTAPKAHKPASDKKKVIQTFAVHDKDTGSAQVQVAILTSRIDSLQSHLKDHPKDNHSRKGLLQMVGKRRKHLDYLKGRKPDDYEKLIQDLGLRK